MPELPTHVKVTGREAVHGSAELLTQPQGARTASLPRARVARPHRRQASSAGALRMLFEVSMRCVSLACCDLPRGRSRATPVALPQWELACYGLLLLIHVPSLAPGAARTRSAILEGITMPVARCRQLALGSTAAPPGLSLRAQRQKEGAEPEELCSLALRCRCSMHMHMPLFHLAESLIHSAFPFKTIMFCPRQLASGFWLGFASSDLTASAT